VSRAKALLGYDPQCTVEEGMTRFWAWYQTHPA
jgi:nucleoside-diphosphate-sugar epimerase